MLSNASEDLTPDYEFEPDADTLLAELLPQYVSKTLFAAMLEAAASESAARRTAMKSATDNANELVNDALARGQPGASGADHPGNHRDRRWRRLRSTDSGRK